MTVPSGSLWHEVRARFDRCEGGRQIPQGTEERDAICRIGSPGFAGISGFCLTFPVQVWLVHHQVLVLQSRNNLTSLNLQDLERGTDLPHGMRLWPDWFGIPHYREMRGADGRRVYPRSPGIHTVRIRTAKRKIGQRGLVRDFSPANRGYTSPLFEITIAADESAVRE